MIIYETGTHKEDIQHIRNVEIIEKQPIISNSSAFSFPGPLGSTVRQQMVSTIFLSPPKKRNHMVNTRDHSKIFTLQFY